MSDPHEMDRYLGNFSWNDLNPDEQEIIGSALWEAAELRPDKRISSLRGVAKRPTVERGKSVID